MARLKEDLPGCGAGPGDFGSPSRRHVLGNNSFLTQSSPATRADPFNGLERCLKSLGNQAKHKHRVFPPSLPFKALCLWYLINLHSKFWKGRLFSSCHGDCKSGNMRRQVSCGSPPLGALGESCSVSPPAFLSESLGGSLEVRIMFSRL